MPKFQTIKIPAEAKGRLDEIRANLARRLGSGVSIAQATVAAIETLHRIQNDPDLAITSRRQLSELARRISDELSERNAAAVCGAVRELTGLDATVEKSEDGRFYTIRANGGAVILTDSAADLAGRAIVTM